MQQPDEWSKLSQDSGDKLDLLQQREMYQPDINAMGFWERRRYKKEIKRKEKLLKQLGEQQMKIIKSHNVKIDPESIKQNNAEIRQQLQSGTDKEVMYLKSLYEVEKVVAYCKKKGFTTKQDWVREHIPMRELVKDMAQNTDTYWREKEAYLKKEFDMGK